MADRLGGVKLFRSVNGMDVLSTLLSGNNAIEYGPRFATNGSVA